MAVQRNRYHRALFKNFLLLMDILPSRVIKINIEGSRKRKETTMRMFIVKNCSLDTPIGPMVPEKPAQDCFLRLPLRHQGSLSEITIVKGNYCGNRNCYCYTNKIKSILHEFGLFIRLVPDYLTKLLFKFYFKQFLHSLLYDNFFMELIHI